MLQVEWDVKEQARVAGSTKRSGDGGESARVVKPVVPFDPSKKWIGSQVWLVFLQHYPMGDDPQASWCSPADTRPTAGGGVVPASGVEGQSRSSKRARQAERDPNMSHTTDGEIEHVLESLAVTKKRSEAQSSQLAQDVHAMAGQMKLLVEGHSRSEELSRLERVVKDLKVEKVRLEESMDKMWDQKEGAQGSRLERLTTRLEEQDCELKDVKEKLINSTAAYEDALSSGAARVVDESSAAALDAPTGAAARVAAAALLEDQVDAGAVAAAALAAQV